MQLTFNALSELQIIETYEFYDRPLLYSCRDSLDHIYLALFVDHSDESETWMLAEASANRFERIRNGQIDLHEAFARPEAGFIYMVTEGNDGLIRGTEQLLSSRIDGSLLPDPGERLSLATGLPVQTQPFRAMQSLRDHLSLVFGFSRPNPNEAPMDKLGSILSELQSLIDFMGTDLFQQQVPLVVLATPRGSFGLEVETDDTVNIFGESRSSDTLQEFAKLLGIHRDATLLSSELRRFQAKTAQSFVSFLKSISGSVSETAIQWDSPVSGYGGHYRIESNDVLRMLEGIKSETRSETVVRTFEGAVRGINLDTRYISLRDEMKSSFSGQMTKEVSESDIAQTIQINQRYIATIEQTEVYDYFTGEKDEKHRVIQLDRV